MKKHYASEATERGLLVLCSLQVEVVPTLVPKLDVAAGFPAPGRTQREDPVSRYLPEQARRGMPMFTSWPVFFRYRSIQRENTPSEPSTAT